MRTPYALGLALAVALVILVALMRGPAATGRAPLLSQDGAKAALKATPVIR